MLIHLDDYPLPGAERVAILRMLSALNRPLDLEGLWWLMDQAWIAHGCSTQPLDQGCLDAFYRDPVWTLNGIFIEQDDQSMLHRHAFAGVLASLGVKQVLDVGGGFGTLARQLDDQSAEVRIDILEPYPTSCMLSLCQEHPGIRFVDCASPGSYDALICTDVLEHIQDPLKLLVGMIEAVKLDGHLLIANCFEPVILCHLPATFHLKYSFDHFCEVLGLQRVDRFDLPYGALYRKVSIANLTEIKLRRLERWSRRLYPWRRFCEHWLLPFGVRLKRASRDPLYYPKKLLKQLH
jgi:SAM-dependent methyltransferase